MYTYLRLLARKKHAESNIGAIAKSDKLIYQIFVRLSVQAPSISPVDNLRIPGCICAQILGLWFDANPAEIQAIGVPAGLYRAVSFCQAVAMIAAGIGQAVEIPGRKIDY